VPRRGSVVGRPAAVGSQKLPKAKKGRAGWRVASPRPSRQWRRVPGSRPGRLLMTYSPSRRSAPFGETEKEKESKGRPGTQARRDAERWLLRAV
jgi:hypothetical protein